MAEGILKESHAVVQNSFNGGNSGYDFSVEAGFVSVGNHAIVVYKYFPDGFLVSNRRVP